MSLDQTVMRRKYEAGLAVTNARRTVALAKIRCLPFDILLTRLRSILDDQSAEEVHIAICEHPHDHAQHCQLADVVRDLASKDNYVPPGKRAWLDRRLRYLIRTLPSALARPIAMEFLEHPRKSRREAGFQCIEIDAFDDDTTRHFLSRFEETGDHRFLKALLRHPLRLSAVNPALLIERFDDDYWQMRVAEATLRTDFDAGIALATTHPRPFIWASGRLGDQRLLPFVSECLRVSNDKARLVGITAWAFGKLKAHDQLLQLEPLLDELEHQNRIDWDNLTAGRAIAGESQ
jgi:hypothetical protein